MQVLTFPVGDYHMLIPVSMVAQITGRLPLTPTSLDIPGTEGFFKWRNLSVPLFRSSELMGSTASDEEDYRQIIMLWPMKSAGNHSFIGLTSPGKSRMITVNDLKNLEENPGLNWVLSYVSLPEGIGLIPDLDALARRTWNHARDREEP